MTDFAHALFPTEGGAPNRQSEGDAGARLSADAERAAATMFPSDAGRTDGPALDVETLIEDRGITGLPAAMLRAVWDGRGHRVPTERLFDVIWADDPNGGPSPSSMYLRTRRAHQYLNEALAGSGVSVVRVRGGWRLRLG